MLATVHILTELTTILNTVVVFVYWPLLHKLALEALVGDECKTLHMYLVHTFPALSLIIIYATTDIQLSPTHWKGFVPIALVYEVINCIATKVSGEPLYPIFDWKDYKTPLLLLIIKIIFFTTYVLVANLTIWINSKKKR